MTLEDYQGNLIDWINFFPAGGGLERDAKVLLLAEKDVEEIYASRIRPRVKRLGLRMEEGQYDYILIPALSGKLLSLFRDSLQEMLFTLIEKYLLPGGELLLGVRNEKSLESLATAYREENCAYTTLPDLQHIGKNLKAKYEKGEERIFRFPPWSILCIFIRRIDFRKKGKKRRASRRLCRKAYFRPLLLAFCTVSERRTPASLR